ncbi:MAG: nucleotidyltransferase [bacterium (Candidatus Ratteibacteria) CG_4_9_14_3_um_filter_41_21]|uniref:Nucleotidyltransferase n=1 Tax=bacterium (Candidatus Ratteibacteria) CG_4_9_14_3_um_filter_41_21 TaxID=2014289 RepID=A0A2M7YG72_9BACT|nr:MAG: nucleotidyltransferase [bacterium (Candidatus Ratteibacteria) CG_4_9_14_3_um_filter_41_21]
MQALILAGGLGSRLRPLTFTTPKPLLPLVNKPLLLYQIELFRKYGAKEIILSISYLREQISDYFGNGKKYGVKITYALEKKRLGTGGGVKNSEKFIKEKTFISNSDIIADVDLEDMLDFHQKHKSDLTMTLFPVADPSAYGLVKTSKDGRILSFLEKPKFSEITTNTINAGFYLFEPELLNFIPNGVEYSLERELFPQLLKKGKRLFGYIHSGYWQDLGTPEKYLDVSSDILNGRLKYPISGRKKGALIAGKGSKISGNLKIKGKLVCGKNVIVEDDVWINGSVVLGDNCQVGKEAKLADCIIFANTRIKEKVEIENAIIGRDCLIGAYNKIGKETVLNDKSLAR